MKISVKPGALEAPLPPVMVSCGREKPNIITVAWTGMLSTQPPRTYISVRPSRHSYGIIKEEGEFVLNLTPDTLVRTADWCGTYTGAKVNKFEKCSLTPEKAEGVGCPAIAECPISIACRVREIVPSGSHDIFIADIVSVSVDEKLFDGEGKIRFEKAGLCAYVHGEYYSLGKKLGYFGFSAAKKKRPHTAGAGKGRQGKA